MKFISLKKTSHLINFVVPKYEMNRVPMMKLFSMGALLVTIIVYSLLGNFHFLPLTEGWFSAYAHQVLEGKIPYRDFYIYLTPLYVWIISLITAIFGTSLFALRVFGVFITCSIALILFQIIRSKFSPASSYVGATLGMIYYQYGNAYINYDFTQVLTLFTLLSFKFLIESEKVLTIASLNRAQSPKLYIALWLPIFLSGLFSSFAFLTKQSNGSFIVLFDFVAFLYLIFNMAIGTSQRIKIFFCYVFGAGLPLLVVIAYLGIHNAHSQFFQQIFFNALSSKGEFIQIFNWVYGVFTPALISRAIEIAKLIIPIYVLSKLISWMLKKNDWITHFFNQIEPIREVSILLLFFFLYILIITFAWQDNFKLRDIAFLPGRHLLNDLIPISIFWTIGQLIFLVLMPVLPKTLQFSRSTFILAICSTGLFFGNGASAGLSEISAFVAIGWVTAWLCNRNSFPLFGIWIAVLFCAFLTTTFTYIKFDKPYAWWGVSAPNARQALETIDNPILQHIYVSPETKNDFINITQALGENPNASIFAFPNIPLIYLLTNRWPSSKVVIPWFDFLNDSDAIEEFYRITNSPPDTIAYLQLPEVAWSAHERLFRNGNPMGQRKILEFINKSCILENGYKITLKRMVSPDSTLFVCQKL